MTEVQPGGQQAAGTGIALPAAPDGMHFLRMLQLGPVRRFVTIAKDAIDIEARTVELSFSSETPVDQGWGVEILGHDPGEVNLDRLASGTAAGLVNHDPNQQVAVVERAAIANGRGTALLRYGKGQQASEVFQDIVDGIRQCVSVGYWINSVVLVESDDTGNTYRVTSWEPFEISNVAIPADTSVGVGRSHSPAGETRSIPVYKRGADMSVANPSPIPVPAVEPTAIPAQVRSGPVLPTHDEILAAERTRVTEIMTIARSCNMAEAGEIACREGRSLAAFHGQVALHFAAAGERSPVRPATELGLTEDETNRYSLFRALNAAATRDWSAAGFELECSKAVRSQLQKAGHNGKFRGHFHLPYDKMVGTARDVSGRLSAQRDLTKGAGGAVLVGTTHLSGSFIEALTPLSVLLTMGALTLPGLIGDVEIPRQDALQGIYWVAEAGNATESDPAFSQLGLTPHTIVGKTNLTRRLLLQSTPAAEILIQNGLMKGVALGIDSVGISSSGAGNTPTGILHTTGVGALALGANGAAANWANIVALETLVAASNADQGTLGYLTSVQGRGKLKTTDKTAGGYGQFLWGSDNTVNGYKGMGSNQVPSNLTKGTGTNLSALIFGNFADVIMAEWGVMEVKVEDVTLADQGGVTVRIFNDVDVGIRHAASFSAAVDYLTL